MNYTGNYNRAEPDNTKVKKKPSSAKKIVKYLKKNLKKSRYEHTLGVMYTGVAMAMAFGESVDKARLAGLLHDCAKHFTEEELLKICEDNSIYISDHEYAMRYLLHSKVGAHLAKSRFGIKDDDILNAIRFHTTGRPGMSFLEKIIFIADYIEPNRDPLPNIKEVRRLAFNDIDLCMYTILKDTLSYLDGKRSSVDPSTRDTFLYYKRLVKDRLPEDED